MGVRQKEHRPTVGATCSVVLFVSCAILALTGGPAAAGVPAPGGTFSVTGYGRLTLYDKPQKPVTVTANGRQAAAIRAALKGLLMTTPSFCMENVNEFTITFRPGPGDGVGFVATEGDCPSPGVVTVTYRGAKAPLVYRETCSLRKAVLAALPKGRAEGTRKDASRCAP
jgi:hypothetical protein